MSAIRILSDRVANQIAAGEVIERPVAAVKELVENSLDAGAKRIEVEFRAGGKQLIRVEDDGSGMSGDEALMALERHATSKVRDIDDLLTIGSFGFRGEALPSIASVSRFTLRTRRAEDEAGTEVLVNGGKLIHKRACGMAPGTRIEVAQLFNSVPARRKFLKTDNTEAAHIVQLLRLLAVANPEVGFRLLENGRVVLQSPSCDDLRERIGEIWNRSLADDLRPIAGERDGMRLHGLIGRPGAARATRQELITLVNRRPVDSRTLSYAVIEAFHGFLPRGRYPVAFLFLEIDPAAVDVNVHPAKREVRFRDESRLRTFVLSTVLETLRAEARKTGQAAPEPAAPTPQPNTERPRPPSAPPTPPVAQRPVEPAPTPQPAEPAQPTPVRPRLAIAPDAHRPADPPKRPTPTQKTDEDWRFIGRFDQDYGLFQAPEGLILLHERAAWERIRFEQIIAAMQADAHTVQRLLFPVPLELEPLATQAFEDLRQPLTEWGFEIELFGRNFYRAHAVPDWLGTEDAADFLRDLAALARERGSDFVRPHLAREAAARLAASRLTPRRLEKENLPDLCRRLLACENPLADLQGRPTLIQFDKAELRRRFNR